MWWRDAVIYQIYPRSFADSNGDGVGDLPGITSRLDHLAWLGVDTLWLSPIHPSPNADWGYDVSDYVGVHPDLGTLGDVDELVSEAGARGLQVVLDLVPNHTSDQHAWFVDARSSRDSRHRDFYVWADPAPDASGAMGPPNNWVSSFGGPAWTLDDASGQYYLHNFLPEQPDLNWWNDEVRGAFDDILRFWFDRGIAGFRIDVCHMIVKDRELRDNPPVPDDAHWYERLRGQRQEFNADRPEVHDVLRRWRGVADAYDLPRLLLGEVYLLDVGRMVAFYGGPGATDAGDELSLAFNFSFLHSTFDAKSLRAGVEEVEGAVPPHAWPAWTGSNHDVSRFATRWAEGDPERAKCALLMLMALRGTPVLYYGDEIAMEDVTFQREQLRDPVGQRFFPVYAGRDPCRTPMVWADTPGAGFTDPGVEPWLPIGSLDRNVMAQQADPGSVLRFCRDAIALRRSFDDLRTAPYEPLDTPDGTWAFRRGSATAVLNLSAEEATVDGIEGAVALATERGREGEEVAGSVRLGPWEGVILSGC